MNYEMSFQERARLAAEHLSKQKPTTYEKAKAQAMWVQTAFAKKKKKQRPAK